jgi:hypothetical protein
MKQFESLREYRRDTAAYWLRNARRSFKLSKELDKPGDTMFLGFAMRDMRRYAEWKAAAERATW